MTESRIMLLDGETCAYELKRSVRARNVRITIRSNGAVTLTVPMRVSESAAQRFLEEKRLWIARTRERIAARGEIIELPGGKRDFALKKDEALARISERLAYFNQRYGFAFRRVTVRFLKSRWGSCTADRNLSFNYRLLYVPPELFDYVVVHELCHCKEMNHSARFWTLVSQTIPDYRERRAALRAYHL